MIALVLAASLTTTFPADLLRERACPSGLMDASVRPGALLRQKDLPDARVRRLTDLPRAEAEHAVLRLVDGCPVPAKAQYRVPPH